MNEEKQEGAVPSPLQPEPQAFDYDKLRDETTVKTVSDILKILGKYSDQLAYDSKATPTSVVEAEEPVIQEMILAMIENKVPEGDMDTLTQTFQVLVHRLFDQIARLKREYEREFLARALNGRNPGDGHYSREYSTLGDLYAGLEKIRTEQKDDPKGYFYNVKKAE